MAKMRTRSFFFVVITFVFLLFGCSSNWEVDQKEAGVVLKGEWHSLNEQFPAGSQATLSNTNAFSVGIREVWLGDRGGENTLSFFVLSPEESKKIRVFTGGSGLHLYKDGIQIGFLKPNPEEKGVRK